MLSKLKNNLIGESGIKYFWNIKEKIYFVELKLLIWIIKKSIKIKNIYVNYNLFTILLYLLILFWFKIWNLLLIIRFSF